MPPIISSGREVVRNSEETKQQAQHIRFPDDEVREPSSSDDTVALAPPTASISMKSTKSRLYSTTFVKRERDISGNEDESTRRYTSSAKIALLTS